MSTKAHIAIIAIILATVTACVISYPRFPDELASHWNAEGVADGTMSKFWGLALFPIIMVFLYGLAIAIPYIDPLRANIESFRKEYDAFFIFMELFFLYLFALILAWNFGATFNVTMFIVPVVALLFFLLGRILPRMKRNWFMGIIRTPWTLSNDRVWEKTHEFGGRLFTVAGIATLGSLVVQNGTATVFIIAYVTTIAAIASIVYSYVEYRKELRR